MLAKSIKDALVKQAIEKVLGLLFGSAAVAALATATLRSITGLPLYWQIAGGMSGFAVSYFLLLRYRPYWTREVAPTNQHSPALDVRLGTEVDGEIVGVSVYNDGPSQEFTGQFNAIFAARYDEAKFPVTVRWKGTTAETRAIPTSHARVAELVRVKWEKAEVSGQFVIGEISVLGVGQEIRIYPEWFEINLIVEPIVIPLQLTGVETGQTSYRQLYVEIGTTGLRPPKISAYIKH